MGEPVYPGCQDVMKRIAELEACVAELTRKFEEATRAGKRQTAPFRMGPPKPAPNPGYKSSDTHGHRAPRPVRSQSATKPRCPTRAHTATARRSERAWPNSSTPRSRDGHWSASSSSTWAGVPAAARPLAGGSRLMTADALGAAASRVGLDAQAAIAPLHTQAGLSCGKVAAMLSAPFGITLTRGACAKITARAGIRLESQYQQVLTSPQPSKQLSVDENGWHPGGHSDWLRVWVGDAATDYAIDSPRGAEALERVVGADWSGVLGQDGYTSYDRLARAEHQSCLAHVFRRAWDLLAGATRGAVVYPRQLFALFTEAIYRRNQLAGRVEPDEERDRQRWGFDDRLPALVRRPRGVLGYATLARHLYRHLEYWFTFVIDPTVETTNWKAEQAICPAVVNRKVWRGSRTRVGTNTQQVLMSACVTCRRHARAVLDLISAAFRAWGDRRLQGPTLPPVR